MASPAEYPWTTAFRRETSAQRSRHTLTFGEQSVSQCAAALHSRETLSLQIRADSRLRLVEARINWRMVAGAFAREC